MIKLRNISKYFQLGDQTVYGLDRVNLDIAAGDYLSVMGPSGSGKSTLLNILGLLDQPNHGQYQLLGHNSTELSEEQRAELRQQHIGFVFQAYHLIPRLNARENIELPMMLAGIPPEQRRQHSDHALQRLGLLDRAEHLPNQLSGGQRQRVAIARAIVMKPHLLLADEPTGNLDSHSGNEVIKLLEELNAEGITLLVVTHDAALGKRAQRQLQMSDGCIVQDRVSTTEPG